MRAAAKTAGEALVSVFAAYGGLWLVEQLRDPTSNLRLRAAELADRLREVKRT